jgi:hypothetical protein
VKLAQDVRSGVSLLPKTGGLGLRHYCRNVRCGAKLKKPADNPRDAFCCVGCFESYFRNRCLVRERPFKRSVSAPSSSAALDLIAALNGGRDA